VRLQAELDVSAWRWYARGMSDLCMTCKSACTGSKQRALTRWQDDRQLDGQDAHHWLANLWFQPCVRLSGPHCIKAQAKGGDQEHEQLAGHARAGSRGRAVGCTRLD
jgi:hypothetical protein